MYFSKAKPQSQSAQPSFNDLNSMHSISSLSNRPSSAIQKNLFNFSIYYALDRPQQQQQYQGPSPALAASSQILANGIQSSSAQQQEYQTQQQQIQNQNEIISSNNEEHINPHRQLRTSESNSNGVRILLQHSSGQKFKPLSLLNGNNKHAGSSQGLLHSNNQQQYNQQRRSVTRIKLVGFSGDPEFQQMKDTSAKLIEANDGMVQLKTDEIDSEIDYDLRLKHLKRSSSAFLPAYKAFRNSSNIPNSSSNININGGNIGQYQNGQITPMSNSLSSQQQLALFQAQQSSQNKRPFYFLTEKNEPLFTLKQLQDKIPLKDQAHRIIEQTEEAKQQYIQQQMQYSQMYQSRQSALINTSDFLTATASAFQDNNNNNNSNSNVSSSRSILNSSYNNGISSRSFIGFNSNNNNTNNSMNYYYNNTISRTQQQLDDFGDKKHVFLQIRTYQKNSNKDNQQQSSSTSLFFPWPSSSQTDNNNTFFQSTSKNGSPNSKLISNTVQSESIPSLSYLPQIGFPTSDNISSLTSSANIGNSNSNLSSFISYPNSSNPSTSNNIASQLNYNNGEPFKLVIELYTKIAPKACENFLKLCEGVLNEGIYLTFRDTQAIRFKKNGFIQMGFSKPGISIYNGYFEDESFAVAHDKPGIIGYCNRGAPHSNSGQFYITLAEMKSFDKKMVAFGRVISGFSHLEKINKIMNQQMSDIPPFNIMICDSGVIQTRPSTNQSRKSNSSTPTRNEILGLGDQDHILDVETQRIIRPDIFYYRGEKPSKFQTYENYVIGEAEKHKEVAQAEYISLMLAIQGIAFGCTEILKYSYNYKTIDKIRDAMKEVFVSHLSDCQSVALLYDTKDDEVFIESNLGKFVVAFTSLDVDSLADMSSCGSLFLIYRKTTTSFRPAKRSDLLQSGESIYGAGYIMYGQSTQIVFHTGYRLNGFTLDPEANLFILTHPRIKASKNGGIISCDESKLIDGNIAKFIRRKKIIADAYVTRYVGSRVSDFHRTLLYGGILIYPQKEVNIYEAFCLSYIIDKAWDRSSCGQEGQVLIKKPLDLTDKIQLYIGYSQDVLEIDNLYLSIRRKNSLYKIHDVPSLRAIKISSYSTHKSTINSPTKLPSQKEQQQQ